MLVLRPGGGQRPRRGDPSARRAERASRLVRCKCANPPRGRARLQCASAILSQSQLQATSRAAGADWATATVVSRSRCSACAPKRAPFRLLPLRPPCRRRSAPPPPPPRSPPRRSRCATSLPGALRPPAQRRILSGFGAAGSAPNHRHHEIAAEPRAWRPRCLSPPAPSGGRSPSVRHGA
jgi:hypothetical protein